MSSSIFHTKNIKLVFQRMGIDYYDAIFEAKQRGYYQLKVSKRDSGHMLSFRHDGKRGGVRINVYFTTGTVATCLDHPQRGKTQLFRRNMTLEDLKKILDDPRTHTRKGYQLATCTVAVER